MVMMMLLSLLLTMIIIIVNGDVDMRLIFDLQFDAEEFMVEKLVNSVKS